MSTHATRRLLVVDDDPKLRELLRRCERQTPTRKAAECLFFTLGGAQVGRAAISGGFGPTWNSYSKCGSAELSAELNEARRS